MRNAFLWGVLIWAAYDWATTAAGMAGATLMQAGVLAPDTPRDQVLMRVVPLYLPVGLSGFFLGGVLATAMSTVDSYLLLAAGNLVYDIYRPLRRPDADDRTLIRYTRLSLFVSAAVCVLMPHPTAVRDLRRVASVERCEVGPDIALRRAFRHVVQRQRRTARWHRGNNEEAQPEERTTSPAVHAGRDDEPSVAVLGGHADSSEAGVNPLLRTGQQRSRRWKATAQALVEERCRGSADSG